ncbi:MAG TPA: AbrB/MazE/SpoVT family DNA-binding domain-containing protein [Pirellulales bacterium]
MISRIRKWGRSQGIRLPKRLWERAHLAIGDEVEVVARTNEIVLRKRRPHKYNLAKLVAALPRGYQSGELPAGPPMGNEVW